MKILRLISSESIRMATPGNFYGPVVSGKGMLKEVQHFFINKFPMTQLWEEKSTNAECYKKWHRRQINKLQYLIGSNIREVQNNHPLPRNSFSVSTKILDTFMHQLMRYHELRYLYKFLYLPLDRVALQAISRNSITDEIEVPESLRKIGTEYKDNPYSILCGDYYKCQAELLGLLRNVNNALPRGQRLRSRIQLNCILW